MISLHIKGNDHCPAINCRRPDRSRFRNAWKKHAGKQDNEKELRKRTTAHETGYIHARLSARFIVARISKARDNREVRVRPIWCKCLHRLLDRRIRLTDICLRAAEVS